MKCRTKIRLACIKMILTILKNKAFQFKYYDKQLFADGIKYKALQVPWEFQRNCKLNKNVATIQGREAYKQIFLQSNAHRINYSPTDKIKANKVLKYKRSISQQFTDKTNCLGNRKNVNW